VTQFSDSACSYGMSLINQTVADALEAAVEQAKLLRRTDPLGKGRVPLDFVLSPEHLEQLQRIAEENGRSVDEQAEEFILERMKELRKPRAVT